MRTQAPGVGAPKYLGWGDRPLCPAPPPPLTQDASNKGSGRWTELPRSQLLPQPGTVSQHFNGYQGGVGTHTRGQRGGHTVGEMSESLLSVRDAGVPQLPQPLQHPVQVTLPQLPVVPCADADGAMCPLPPAHHCGGDQVGGGGPMSPPPCPTQPPTLYTPYLAHATPQAPPHFGARSPTGAPTCAPTCSRVGSHSPPQPVTSTHWPGRGGPAGPWGGGSQGALQGESQGVLGSPRRCRGGVPRESQRVFKGSSRGIQGGPRELPVEGVSWDPGGGGLRRGPKRVPGGCWGSPRGFPRRGPRRSPEGSQCFPPAAPGFQWGVVGCC